jgi:hypothetical protein
MPSLKSQLSIRKVSWYENAPEHWREYSNSTRPIAKQRIRVTVYRVYCAGTLIDSFQRYRNAQRKVRQLRATSL